MSRLWTFRVTGLEEDIFFLPGNPCIQHRGHSLFHWVLTDRQAQVFSTVLQDRGYLVKSFPMGGESEEQLEERRKIMSVNDRVWPSIKCPECFWFDPREDNPCLYTGAWESTREEILGWSIKAQEDMATCPVLD